MLHAVPKPPLVEGTTLSQWVLTKAKQVATEMDIDVKQQIENDKPKDGKS